MQNGDQMKKSLLEMCCGAFLERTNYEMTKVVSNILDPNTKATAKRKITITFEMIPDDSRTQIPISCTVKSTLATTNPVVTSLYIAGENGSGEMQVVENVPQIPGQTAFDGTEQQAPAILKLLKNA